MRPPGRSSPSPLFLEFTVPLSLPFLTPPPFLTPHAFSLLPPTTPALAYRWSALKVLVTRKMRLPEWTL